ncbi:MAG: glycosyltransferase, partial [Betaproteobacteria bacterium]|nr:glycosyltransferase [Betaproteobacteria bacterium]
NHRIIANGFDTDRYAPHAAARDEFRQSLGIGDDQFLIGWLGRYHPHKDVANMLRAYQIIHHTHPAIKLVMAGKGLSDNNPALAQTLHELGLSGQVLLLGPVAAPQTFLQSLDALALSSATENFPNVIGEAMATAVPCVATNVGDCAQLIGDTGQVVPARSPDPLAAALVALSTLPRNERAAQAARARARIVADFSIAASCKAYLQHYQHLLQRGK